MFDKLDKLLISKKISGFALISPFGIVERAEGDLEADLRGGGDAIRCQFTSAFSSAPPHHFEVGGRRLYTVRSDDSFLLAIARQKQLGVSCHYLHSGTLVVSYSATQQRTVGDVLAVIQVAVG